MSGADNKRIIVALDFATAKEALALSARLSPQLCRVKVGKELFTAAGPALVEQLQNAGFEVFLDLKFHDIPNTVAAACRAASALGVWMVNVHALGGRAMLEAAREAVEHAQTKPKLIAVTLLTSMTQQDLHDIGIEGSPEVVVSRLAGIAQESGLDGVVCSAQEAARLRKERGANFCLVTPGIRLADGKVSGDDQQRIMTLEKAVNAGSDYLVIGRPITQAVDPVAVLTAINAGIATL